MLGLNAFDAPPSVERVLLVEVTALELEEPASGAEKTTPRYSAKIKAADVEGWTPLASLTLSTQP